VYPIPKGDPLQEDRRADAADRLRRFIGRRDGHEQALADVETLARLPALMGTAAVAAELGTTTSNLARWRDLPAPLYDLERGKLYDAAAIRVFAEEKAKAEAKAKATRDAKAAAKRAAAA
jgi:hypothetical protein